MKMMQAPKPFDGILFAVLAPSATVYGLLIFSAQEGGGGDGGPMGFVIGLAIFLSYPVAAIGTIVGLVRYRLWRDFLFWMILAISASATFVGSLNGRWLDQFDIRGALFTTALFAPVFAVPLWQITARIAAMWRARSSS